MATNKPRAKYLTEQPEAPLNWAALDEYVGTLAPPTPAPAPSSVARRVLGDGALTAVKAAISVPEIAVGLADLATGGQAGKAAEAAGFKPREAREILDQQLTPEQQAANREVQQAQGFADTAMAAIENPSTIVHSALESAPSLLPAGAIARGLMKVAPRIPGVAAAALGEGAVSAGQTAEQIRQQTADGLITGTQSSLAVGSGGLTALLGGVMGKLANRLGIGDVNQLVAGVQQAGPDAQKGLVRSILQGMAVEGVLQELPQSAQEQVAQNLALGKEWDDGVGSAAAMGALAGGLMGGVAGPLHNAPTAAQQIRDTKLPETGTMTKGINAGIEATAAAAENAPPREPMKEFGFPTAEKAQAFAAGLGLKLEPVQKQNGSWSFYDLDGEPLASGPVGSMDAAKDAPDAPQKSEAGAEKEILTRLADIKEELADTKLLAQMRSEYGVEATRDFLHVLTMIESGRLPPRTTKAMLDGAERRLFVLRTTAIPQKVEAPQLTAPEQQPALPAPDQAAPLAIGLDSNPTGTIRVDSAGIATPETRPQAAQTAQVIAPSGTMVADQGGAVAVQTMAEADAISKQQREKANLGLTPDVERASMRAAMGNQTREGDLTAAGGMPFRNRSAARTAAARDGRGFQVVEIAPDSFVGRLTGQSLAGDAIDKEWTSFNAQSGSLNIPRAEMPQIKAEHRGAMTNFLNARGIAHEQVDVPAGELKPTQAEFSPAKVEKAKAFTGGDRSILVSSDGHVLDGHHQWLAKLDDGAPVKAIRLDAKMADLLPVVKEFPSAETADGATEAVAEPAEQAAPTRDDEPVLSRGGAASSVQAEELKRAFAGMISGWKDGPSSVTIVQSVADLPAKLSEQLNALDPSGNTRAFLMPTSKKVYLIADNVGSLEEAQEALLHEVYGHLGLRALLGDRYEDALIAIRRANADLAAEAEAWMLKNGADEIAAQVSNGLSLAKAQRKIALLAVEEALSDRAGRNEPLKGWRQFAAALQRGLRAIGLESVANWMEGKTQAEVMTLLAQARSEVQGRVMNAPRGQGDEVLLSRSPAAAIQKMTPDLIKDMIAGRDAKRVSWWHRTVGTMYDLSRSNPEFRRVFEEAQQYISDTSFFANDAADQAPRVLPQLNELKDFTKALTLPEADRMAISAPIFEGTLSWTRDADGKLVETDDVEQAGVVFTAAELADKFGLNAKQIELYREFRAAVDRSLESTAAGDLLRYLGDDAPAAAKDLAREGEFAALRRMVLDHVKTLPAGKLQDEIRSEVDDKLQRVDELKARGYAPLMRFGRHYVRVAGQGGESLFFGLHETATDAARAARMLAAEFPGEAITRGVMSEENFKAFQGLSPETVALFSKISGMDQNEAVQIWLKQATANRSALRRMIRRKGIEGFSDDVSRVLSSFITSNARAASQALHFGQILKDVNDIKAGDVKDAAERLRQYIQNPIEEAAALRGFLFINFIGGSLASAAVNMTQPLMQTAPYLAQFVGITQATKIVGLSMRTVLDYVNGKLTGDLKIALMDAEKRGLVAPQELHQLQAMSMGRGSLLGRAARLLGAGDGIANKLDAAGKRALFIWGAPFALSEQWNRRLTFVAAYQVAKLKGMDDPVGFAAQAVVESQGVYNRGNRPQWARGPIGATLFTFKQFAISYLEFTKRLWMAGEPGSEERANGRKAALFGMAMLLIAAGAQGLPGADDLDDLIDTIGQKLGYDTNAKRWKRDRMPEWLQYGFSALPGIPLDVAGRMSVGNLVPGTGLLRKDKADKSDDVWELAGVAGGLAKNVLAAADTGKVEAMLPVALANLMKGWDIAQHGAYRNLKGQRVVDADGGDAAIKAIGFQPATVAAANRSASLDYSRIALAKNVEAEIAGELAAARFEGDAKGEMAARARLAKWNEDNPGTPIKISQAQIVARVRNMRASREERIQKATPKELRTRAIPN